MRSPGNDRVILTKKIKKINTNSEFGSRNEVEGENGAKNPAHRPSFIADRERRKDKEQKRKSCLIASCNP
jgi:hypothetical protein